MSMEISLSGMNYGVYSAPVIETPLDRGLTFEGMDYGVFASPMLVTNTPSSAAVRKVAYIMWTIDYQG